MRKTKSLIALGGFSVFIFLIVGIHFLNQFAEQQYYSKLKTNNRATIILENTPPRYSKSAHVTTNVKIEDGKYHIQFGFKDHNNTSQLWETTFPKTATDQMIYKFGVPSNFFEPYYLLDDVIAKRKRQMKEGMWTQNGDYVVPDLNAMATYYKGFAQPVAQFIHQSLGNNTTWRNQIDFALRFCQDIPYGVPPDNFNDKKIGEIFTPPQSLINLFADCDSKAVLFAATMSYFEGYEMIFVHVPGHVLLATKGVPGPYDYYFTYKNQKYLYTEPVGPGRFAFGRSSSKYRTISKIIPVKLGEYYPDVTATLITNNNVSSVAEENTNNGNPSDENSDTNNDEYSKIVRNDENAIDDENTKSGILSNPNNKPTGESIFWTDSESEGKITIHLNGEKMGVIASYFEQQPSCEGTQGLRFMLPVGVYQMRAESSNGAVWEGELEIQAETCHAFAF